MRVTSFFVLCSLLIPIENNPAGKFLLILMIGK